MQKQGTTIWRVYTSQDGTRVAHLAVKYVQEEGDLSHWREVLEREMYRYDNLDEDSRLDLLVQFCDELATDMRVIPGRHAVSSYWVRGTMLFYIPFLEDEGRYAYEHIEVWSVRETIGRR